MKNDFIRSKMFEVTNTICEIDLLWRLLKDENILYQLVNFGSVINKNKKKNFFLDQIFFLMFTRVNICRKKE